jgi:hypothetical protein
MSDIYLDDQNKLYRFWEKNLDYNDFYKILDLDTNHMKLSDNQYILELAKIFEKYKNRKNLFKALKILKKKYTRNHFLNKILRHWDEMEASQGLILLKKST